MQEKTYVHVRKLLVFLWRIFVHSDETFTLIQSVYAKIRKADCLPDLFLEETDLAGIRKIPEGTSLFQHLHMGLGNFRTCKAHFLD